MPVLSKRQRRASGLGLSKSTRSSVAIPPRGYGATLWKPFSGVLTVPTKRWSPYPHFADMARQEELPKELSVRWAPFGRFVEPRIGTDDEEEADEVNRFLEEIGQKIRSGVDVPPLIADASGRPLDGIHRAWAAYLIGMRKAPVAFLPKGRR